MHHKTLIAWAAVFGFTGVILGALAAHVLENHLEPYSIDSFNTAVRYQLWHAITLFILGTTTFRLRFQKAITLLWVVGIFLFSGSIFLLSTSALFNADLSFLGPVTPLGGLCFIVGWFLLLLSALQKETAKP